MTATKVTKSNLLLLLVVFASWGIFFFLGVFIERDTSGADLAKDALTLIGQSKEEVTKKIGEPFATYPMSEFETKERPQYREHKDRMPNIEYDEIHRYRDGLFYLYIYYDADQVVQFYGHDS